MKKIVINTCFGGFGLSHVAVMRYAELKGFVLYPWLDHFTREVYKDRAVIGCCDIFHHYSRVPLNNLSLEIDGDPKLPRGAGFFPDDIERDDPVLVQVIEELGKEANANNYADLEVVEIPDDTDYTIEEYDGIEHIAEKHRTWG